jgi:hypothetical protein
MKRHWARVHLAIWLSLLVPFVALAQNPDLAPIPPNQSAQDLKRLTIEELAEIDVTTVSHRVVLLGGADRLQQVV